MQRISPITLAIFLLGAGLSGCTPAYTGMQLARQGKHMAAARLLSEAIKTNPEDGRARRALGLSYLELGDEALAEKQLAKAVELLRSDRISRRYLAITREHLGWQARAMAVFDGLIKDYPDDRLTDVFKAHLTRMSNSRSALTREAVEERIDDFREKGLLDQSGLPRPLLVLPFDVPEVYPDYALLGRSLARMLACDLAKLDLVWVIGPDKAIEAMRLRGIRWNHDDRAAAAKEIGRALGAGLVVQGSFLKGFEKEVRVDIKIFNPEPFSLLRDSKTEGDSKQIFELERNVLNKLLGDVGVLPNERERSRFGNFATHDSAALGLYLGGMSRLMVNDYPGALELLEKSVGRDAEYPCPYRALSVIYRMQGRRDRRQYSANKGRGRGNPSCPSETRLLDFKIRLDSQIAALLQAEIEQGRTALRNGLQTITGDEGEILSRQLLFGPAGNRTTSVDPIPAGMIWGSQGLGTAGTADPSVLGGVFGHGLSSPDPATVGQ